MEVGDDAIGIIPVFAPAEVALGAEGAGGSGAEEAGPVDVAGVGFGLDVILPETEDGVHGVSGLGPEDGADGATADEVAGDGVAGIGAPLGADLEDAAGAADGRVDVAGFGEGEGHGFFEVDVLAGAEGGDGHAVVPMFGGDDEDGVQIGAGE